MTWDGSKYVKLLIWRRQGRGDSWLIALRTTADYYGWTKQFEVWTPKVIGTSGRYDLVMDPGRRGEMFCEGGRRHRVCRSTSRAGNPAGKTNQFKVSEASTLFDLAEIAHFTQGDWYWMETFNGERFSREHWEDIYRAGGRDISPVREGALIR